MNKNEFINEKYLMPPMPWSPVRTANVKKSAIKPPVILDTS
jgi:hypothetical protein